MSLNKEPVYNLITIVTVVFNGEADIEDTMQSVFAQKYPNIEYIVIDGQSTDNTLVTIDKYKDKITKIISEKDHGVYDAMNKAINLAKGQWINFMNCGDQFINENVISDIFGSDLDSDASVIYGDTIYAYNTGEILIKPEPLYTIHRKLPFCHQSCFVKSSLLNHYKFDTKFKIAADHNFFLHLYNHMEKFIYIPTPIAIYALEGGMSSQNVITSYKESALITKSNQTCQYYMTIVLLIVRNIIHSILPGKIINKLRKFLNKNI